MDVKIGQIWQRKKDGCRVKITNRREFRGSTDFELTPLDKGGRKSWKWNQAIACELKLLKDVEL